eukprot:jgi/Mesvir1/27217/Mv07061-RA.1
MVGSLALQSEFYVERAIGVMKAVTRARVSSAPEATLVNHWLLVRQLDALVETGAVTPLPHVAHESTRGSFMDDADGDVYFLYEGHPVSFVQARAHPWRGERAAIYACLQLNHAQHAVTLDFGVVGCVVAHEFKVAYVNRNTFHSKRNYRPQTRVTYHASIDYEGGDGNAGIFFAAVEGFLLLTHVASSEVVRLAKVTVFRHWNSNNMVMWGDVPVLNMSQSYNGLVDKWVPVEALRDVCIFCHDPSWPAGKAVVLTPNYQSR